MTFETVFSGSVCAVRIHNEKQLTKKLLEGIPHDKLFVLFCCLFLSGMRLIEKERDIYRELTLKFDMTASCTIATCTTNIHKKELDTKEIETYAGEEENEGKKRKMKIEGKSLHDSSHSQAASRLTHSFF